MSLHARSAGTLPRELPNHQTRHQRRHSAKFEILRRSSIISQISQNVISSGSLPAAGQPRVKGILWKKGGGRSLFGKRNWSSAQYFILLPLPWATWSISLPAQFILFAPWHTIIISVFAATVSCFFCRKKRYCVIINDKFYYYKDRQTYVDSKKCLKEPYNLRDCDVSVLDQVENYGEIQKSKSKRKNSNGGIQKSKSKRKNSLQSTFNFSIQPHDTEMRTLHLRAETAAERDDWVKAIRETEAVRLWMWK